MAPTRPNAKPLSVLAQWGSLKRAFPEGQGWVYRDELRWRGVIQPTPLCRTYEIELQYRFERAPEVRVVTPELEERNGKRPPHLYPGGVLCLYYPRYAEWNSRMAIADTTLPWASEWLFHYEIWLVTGEWYGGGIH